VARIALHICNELRHDQFNPVIGYMKFSPVFADMIDYSPIFFRQLSGSVVFGKKNSNIFVPDFLLLQKTVAIDMKRLSINDKFRYSGDLLG